MKHIIKTIELDDFSLSMLKRTDDPKKRINVIKDIEKIVRKSYEYRQLIRYLKQELDLTTSTFFKKIDTSQKEFKDISLEFHHTPFTLWDIVDIVLEYHLRNNNTTMVNTFEVADMVMFEHYSMTIGLVPLTTLEHQLIHDGKLSVQKKDVFGKVDKFVEKYREIMNPEQTFIATEFLLDRADVSLANNHTLTVTPQHILMESREEFPALGIGTESISEPCTDLDL